MQPPSVDPFRAGADAYDGFMGRYATSLAPAFADLAGASSGRTALDVGCGPGALTTEFVARLGPAAVTACDPAPAFVAECARRHPGTDVVRAGAEDLPFAADSFDLVAAQLVLHFVDDPDRAAAELARVALPGGVVAACVWDSAVGMEMLGTFWDAALELNPAAPPKARVLRFGSPGEIVELFDRAGLVDLSECTLTVESTYADFGELWGGFQAGIGPAGVYGTSLPAHDQARLRAAFHERLGSPQGPITLSAVARCGVGHVSR